MTELNLEIIPVQPPKMLREHVVVALRDAMARGDLKPGDRLVERELCAITGVSRTSVREALRHLEAEGLVATIPNKGPIVKLLTADEARDIYEVRKALEGLAGALFAERATDEQVMVLRRCFDRATATLESGDIKGCFIECSQFREILFQNCGNKMLYNSVQNLDARISFLRMLTASEPLRPALSLTEYGLIVVAIEKRDPEGARKACERHVAKAGELALKILASRFAESPEVGKRSNGAFTMQRRQQTV